MNVVELDATLEDLLAMDLRVLTVRQPWAWAIVTGAKDVENRTTNVAGAYRGPVAIHAGLAWSRAGSTDPLLRAAVAHAGVELDDEAARPRMPRGAIIGVVDLAGVHRGPVDHACSCSPWAMVQHAGRAYWHLALENPRRLTRPIPWRGRLGLRALTTQSTIRCAQHKV